MSASIVCSRPKDEAAENDSWCNVDSLAVADTNSDEVVAAICPLKPRGVDVASVTAPIWLATPDDVLMLGGKDNRGNFVANADATA